MSSQYDVPDDVTAFILARRLERMKMRGEDEDLTANNARMSPLLRLPGELRNRIYKYVLDNLSARFKYDGTVYPENSIVCEPHALALVQVCRQTHTETLSLEKTCTELSGHVTLFCHAIELLRNCFGIPVLITREELDKIQTVHIEVGGYWHGTYELRGYKMQVVLPILSLCRGLERMMMTVDLARSRSASSLPKSAQVNAVLALDHSREARENHALEALKSEYLALNPQNNVTIKLHTKMPDGLEGSDLDPRSDDVPSRARKSGRRSF